jgi:Tfp pilus assembly protein PilN
MMPRTNLATRPFYNTRAVHAMLALAAVVLLAFTLYNVVQLVRLTASQRTLGAQAAASEEQAQRLRGEAARIRTQIDQAELESVAAAAREANGIIDRRAFSWTELFARLEATLPTEVRITTVQPRVERGINKIGLVVEARQAEDVSEFIEALEATGAFRNVILLEAQAQENDLLAAAIEGEYEPDGTPEAAAQGDTGRE